MIRVELKKLQANLEKYYKLLDDGEHIEVTENGELIYTLTESLNPPKIKFYRKKKGVVKKKRVLGQHAGWINIPDDITSPLPQDIMDTFYKESTNSSKVKR